MWKRGLYEKRPRIKGKRCIFPIMIDSCGEIGAKREG